MSCPFDAVCFRTQADYNTSSAESFGIAVSKFVAGCKISFLLNWKGAEMAKARKDNKGRALRKGETQRKCDGKYVYTYTNPEGKRVSIYSMDLVLLRERDKAIIKDQLDGIDAYAAGTATINFVFDRYIATKSELRETTKTNYNYMYDHFIRKGFGKKKISSIKYSDVLMFYKFILNFFVFSRCCGFAA